MQEDKIIDRFIKAINRGMFHSQEKLPSENSLSAIYQVPRIVARQVYEKLDAMGYTYSIQGKGRYVKEQRRKIELVLSGNESFTDKVTSDGHQLESRNVFCKKIQGNEKVYTELAADHNVAVYKIGRLRMIDGKPVAVHISYVSQAVFPAIDQDGPEILSMFDYYRSKGFSNFQSGRSILGIAYPDEKERKLLQCDSLMPLLVIETACMDGDSKKVLEYTRIKYRSDCFYYVM